MTCAIGKTSRVISIWLFYPDMETEN